MTYVCLTICKIAQQKYIIIIFIMIYERLYILCDIAPSIEFKNLSKKPYKKNSIFFVFILCCYHQHNYII